MPYVKTVWVNDETPVNAENMNNIENGIEDLDKGKQEKLSRTDLDNIASIDVIKSDIQKNKEDILGKQDKLISGSNIKTINGQPILGSGDLPISGGGGGTGWKKISISEYINDGDASVRTHEYRLCLYNKNFYINNIVLTGYTDSFNFYGNSRVYTDSNDNQYVYTYSDSLNKSSTAIQLKEIKTTPEGVITINKQYIYFNPNLKWIYMSQEFKQ